MLTTENAGGVVAGSGQRAGYHTVEMLKATTVRSVGRVVQVGEVVEVDDSDYRFLKPYEFCKDSEVEVEAVEEVADPTADEATTVDATTEDADKTDALLTEISEFTQEVAETIKGKRKV
jgi:hypothetical protein